MLLRNSVSALLPLIAPEAKGNLLPLTQLLIDKYTAGHKNHKTPGTGLVASWEYSLPEVLNALHGRGLDAVEVMIEYKLPHMDGDMDVVLAGYHPTTDDLSYVVVELKQWDKATVSPENPVAVDAGYDKAKLHPVRQVQRYCEHLMHSYALLRGHPERLAGVAFLHNATSEVAELLALPQSSHGRLYTLNTLEQFRKFLATRLSPRSGGQAAEFLCTAAEAPPLSSSEAFSQVGSPHPVFALQKEQEIAFQEVREAVRRSSGHVGKKRVVIVRGGPGSGKTAVAVELLRTLKQEGLQAVHASGSKAFTENLQQAAAVGPHATTKAQAKRDYRFFNQFGSLPPDSVEVLICDEAHRVRRTSTNWRTPKDRRATARPQADELISVAGVPVFLLDDWQSLRPDEVGTTQYLVDRAKASGCDWTVIDLPGMFRAGGSVEFRRWVTRLLSLDSSTPVPWTPDGRMEVRIADSPEELEGFLRKQIADGNGNARMTAGFCWDWKKPPAGQVLLEVQIGDWHRSWNTRPDVTTDAYPSTSLWATDPRGFDQIGCIFTAQNFEFDWSGVIIGRDLVWRDGRFVVDRAKTRDGKLREKQVSDEDVDRLVRNAYHVLLTRGRRGTVIFAEDGRTQDALRSLLPGTVGKPLPKPKSTVPGAPADT